MSDAMGSYAKDPSYCLRVGWKHGQDLSRKYERWLAFGLITRFRPPDVVFPWPCTAWCAWSRLNAAKSEATAKRIEQDRHAGRNLLRLFARIYDAQTDEGRHCHGENPLSSDAWREPPIHRSSASVPTGCAGISARPA